MPVGEHWLQVIYRKMTTEKLLNYEFLRPQDMSRIENSFTFWEMQQTLKVAHISQFSQIEGEFSSEMHTTYDVCLCKIHKSML